MSPQDSKIVGQCPICQMTFQNSDALRAHMEDPPNHDPPIDLDVQSTGTFGELSGDDSDFEEEVPHKSQAPFESEFFDQEFAATEPEYMDPFERLGATQRQGALGVLYCKTCDGQFGNKQHYMRHFMFHPKHGEESREYRNFYHLMWRQSWVEAAKEKAGVSHPPEDIQMPDVPTDEPRPQKTAEE